MSGRPIHGATVKDSESFPGGNRFTRTLRRISAKVGMALWAPLAVFILTFIVNLVFLGTEADSRQYGNDELNPFFLIMFIYSFIVYYYIVYGIITLIRKRFPGNYHGTETNYRPSKGTLSLIINLVFFGAFALMPPMNSTGMIPLSLPMTFLWGVPGFLIENGVKSCVKSLAGTRAGKSHHPERESLDELRAKGYTIDVRRAVFDQRGGAVVHVDVSHPRHHAIKAARFFRFGAGGALDRSYTPPPGIPEYGHVLPLPDGRFFYYPDSVERGGLPAFVQDNEKNFRVTIDGVWELRVPWALDRTTILGIDGTSIVKIRLPPSLRDGVRLDAEQFINMKNVAVQGYHVDSFTFRPATDGRILCVLNMDNDDPKKPGMALLATFSPSGRMLSKRRISGEFVHDFDYGACIDPAGGLLYVRVPGGGDSVARVRPDGREDAAFNDRFIATCGFFYMIMSISSDREGRILVSGRTSPDNIPVVLLADKNGRKIRTIYRRTRSEKIRTSAGENS